MNGIGKAHQNPERQVITCGWKWTIDLIVGVSQDGAKENGSASHVASHRHTRKKENKECNLHLLYRRPDTFLAGALSLLDSAFSRADDSCPHSLGQNMLFPGF